MMIDVVKDYANLTTRPSSNTIPDVKYCSSLQISFEVHNMEVYSTLNDLVKNTNIMSTKLILTVEI